MRRISWRLPPALELPVSGRRSTRDWVVDSLLFTLAVGFTVLVTGDQLRPADEVPRLWTQVPTWLALLDLGTSMAAAVGLWFRRGRGLLPLAVLTLVMSVYSLAGAVTVLAVLLTIAIHCRVWVLGAYAILMTGTSVAYYLIRPEAGESFATSMWWTTAAFAIVSLWGIVIRSRRQLVLSLRDRAERAETEQQLRVAQARHLERTRIAREMHDVLAHRISLLSLHAGALEIKSDAPPEEIAAAAGVVRASAHQALQDLREVIGVLREERPDDRPEQPQPTLGALPALAEESRSAGIRVRLEVGVEPEAVPAGTGRTAYRIVQEGLTNARKHAPGTAVRVAVGGSVEKGLTIEIRNPWPVGDRATGIPGTGSGLIGLTERATLAGGRLSHGRTPDNEFAVTAWLPWPAA